MTSQIRFHIEYVIQTYNNLVLTLHSKNENSSLTDVFKYDLMMILDSDLLFWDPPCILQVANRCIAAKLNFQSTY